MKVNGFIIKQMREHASLARDNFTAICSTADLELIEEKNWGIGSCFGSLQDIGNSLSKGFSRINAFK